MSVSRNLDVLTCGGFHPYRDPSTGVVRLLDLMPSSKPSKTSKRLQRLALAAFEAGLAVDSEERYRAWYATYWTKFHEACVAALGELGRCMGDEGHEWLTIGSRLLDAVHCPGWRIGGGRPLAAGDRVKLDSPRPGTVIRSDPDHTLVAWDDCTCAWCEAGKLCQSARLGNEYEVLTEMVR